VTALLAALVALAPPADAAAREERFLQLLRTYPERPPSETFQQVGRLVEEGNFPQRPRAEYWIGSARLAAGDLDGARQWFVRVGRDYPGSVWDERGWLGMAEAAARERNFGEALRWYAKAETASDAAVRELGRIGGDQGHILRRRQRVAWAAAAVALAIAGFLALGARGGKVLPLPAETRVVLPVLGVLALLSSRVDPAPRGAVLTVCAAGALLSLLLGLRLRVASLRLPTRALHAALALVALACVAYVAIYRADMIGMVQETVRTGARG
jgi:tetratricopeptide (TPR) repeat protein